MELGVSFLFPSFFSFAIEFMLLDAEACLSTKIQWFFALGTWFEKRGERLGE